MKPDIEIRRVGPNERGLLDNIAEAVFDGRLEREGLAAYLAAPGHLLLVALDGTLVIGQCEGVVIFHPDKGPELFVNEIGVAPSYQRQGIARRLLDATLALGRERGCTVAWVPTEPDNEPARALYRHFGEGDPCVIYETDLSSSTDSPS